MGKLVIYKMEKKIKLGLDIKNICLRLLNKLVLELRFEF